MAATRKKRRGKPGRFARSITPGDHTGRLAVLDVTRGRSPAPGNLARWRLVVYRVARVYPEAPRGLTPTQRGRLGQYDLVSEGGVDVDRSMAPVQYQNENHGLGSEALPV